MRVVIGCDHTAIVLKKVIIDYLENNGYEVNDVGTNDEQRCDYPDIAKLVGDEVVKSNDSKGILICGTGIGMSIAANKLKGIRAAVCSDIYSARLTKAHNNTNIICFGNKVIGEGVAIDIVDIWLTTNYEGGRHQRRLDKISSFENNI